MTYANMIQKTMWLMGIVLLLLHFDHTTGKRPGEGGSLISSYVEVQQDFYEAYGGMVDALWEANEDMPESCRTDLCYEDTKMNSDRQYNLTFPQTRGGERRYVVCPWSLDGAQYAYRDCNIKVDGSFVKKSDFAGVSWSKYVNTEACTLSPVSQVVRTLVTTDTPLFKDISAVNKALDELINVIERFPNVAVHKKYLLPYVFLLQKIVQTFLEFEVKLPWSRVKLLLRLINQAFHYDKEWGILFAEEFTEQELLHSIAIGLFQYVLENAYNVFDKPSLETFEQDHLIFVPVGPSDVRGQSVHITDGFHHYQYYLEDPNVYNVTQQDRVFVEKNIPKVNLQFKEPRGEHGVFVVKSSYIWFDQTQPSIVVPGVIVLAYSISSYFQTDFFLNDMLSDNENDDSPEDSGGDFPLDSYDESQEDFYEYYHGNYGYYSDGSLYDDMFNFTDDTHNSTSNQSLPDYSWYEGWDDFFPYDDFTNETYHSDDTDNYTAFLHNDSFPSKSVNITGPEIYDSLKVSKPTNPTTSSSEVSHLSLKTENPDVVTTDRSTVNEMSAKDYIGMVTDNSVVTPASDGPVRNRREIAAGNNSRQRLLRKHVKQEEPVKAKVMAKLLNMRSQTGRKKEEELYGGISEYKGRLHNRSYDEKVDILTKYKYIRKFIHSGEKTNRVNKEVAARKTAYTHRNYTGQRRQKRSLDMIIYDGAVGPLVFVAGHPDNSTTNPSVSLSIYMGYHTGTDVHLMGYYEIEYVKYVDITSNDSDKNCSMVYDNITRVMAVVCHGAGLFTGFLSRVYVLDSLFPDDDPEVLKINLPSFLGFLYSVEVSVVENVLGGLSLVCLLCTLLTYANLKKDDVNVSNQILLHLTVSLTTLSIVLNIVHNIELTKSACRVVNILRYYLIFVTLLWNGAEAVNMYLKIIKVYNSDVEHFVLKAGIIAWGMPALFVAINFLVSRKAFDGEYVVLQEVSTEGECSYRCQLRTSTLYYGYLTPMCVLMVINLTIFGMVTYIMVKQGRKEKDGCRRRWTQLTGAVSLLMILGIPWIFSVFGAFNAQVSKQMTTFQGFMQLVFAVAVNLQGLFIFAFYCLKKREIRKAWQKMLTG